MFYNKSTHIRKSEVWAIKDKTSYLALYYNLYLLHTLFTLNAKIFRITVSSLYVSHLVYFSFILKCLFLISGANKVSWYRRRMQEWATAPPKL